MADATQPDTSRNRGDYDAPHETPVSPADDARTIAINRISWGAVFAGVAVALVTHLILNLIGIGIGAASLDVVGPGGPEASSFGIGAGIWFVVTGIIAALLGGHTAARLSGSSRESTGGWHGLTTWALTTLVIFWLLTTAVGGLIGGAFNTLTGTVGGMASTVGAAAGTTAEVAAQTEGTDPFAAIQEAITGALPEGSAEAAIAAVRAAVTGDPAEAEQAREEAAQSIASAQNIPIEQARTQVAQYEAQYRQTVDGAGEQAAEVADTAATAVSTTALLGAFSLILGAVAGWFGGRSGVVEPTVTTNRLRNMQARWRPASGDVSGEKARDQSRTVIKPEATRTTSAADPGNDRL